MQGGRCMHLTTGPIWILQDNGSGEAQRHASGFPQQQGDAGADVRRCSAAGHTSHYRPGQHAEAGVSGSGLLFLGSGVGIDEAKRSNA